MELEMIFDGGMIIRQRIHICMENTLIVNFLIFLMV